MGLHILRCEAPREPCGCVDENYTCTQLPCSEKFCHTTQQEGTSCHFDFQSHRRRTADNFTSFTLACSPSPFKPYVLHVYILQHLGDFHCYTQLLVIQPFSLSVVFQLFPATVKFRQLSHFELKKTSTFFDSSKFSRRMSHGRSR